MARLALVATLIVGLLLAGCERAARQVAQAALVDLMRLGDADVSPDRQAIRDYLD